MTDGEETVNQEFFTLRKFYYLCAESLNKHNNK